MKQFLITCFNKSTVPHTPSAVRYARAAVADGQTLCCLLSRTNGFEWLAIYTNPDLLEALLIEARATVVNHAWYAPNPDEAPNAADNAQHL